MKRKITTLMVMLLAFALLISTAPITASAETTTYTPTGGSATFTKNLVVDSDANIPSILFKYQSRRGTPQDATASTVEILAATTGGEVEDAVFSNDDTANTINGDPTDADPSTPTPGKKYAQKLVKVNFPEDTFIKPGVYRFVISEINNNLPGVNYDTNPTRYLDVFVVADADNVLKIDGYVFRDAPTDINTSGEYVTDPGAKSSGYTNSLTQYDFEFSKTISGNQADKNKRFAFTLTITGANPGVYPVEANDVTGNPTSITVSENGTATAVYNLTDGSTFKVIGLNEGAVCNVTENAEDYTATHILDSGQSVSGNSSGEVTLANSDHSVAFTNTRNGIIPEGVIMTIAPFAIGICVFGAIIVFIISRRKRRNY